MLTEVQELQFTTTVSSYFYQLTAPILDDKNLSHAEKILMTIFNGLIDSEGKCWPSNEWLCGKMDLTERPIRTLLENLEEKGYIERVIVPSRKNPLVRYRLIYVTAFFKYSLRAAENSRSVGLKTAGIIDKKEIIEETTTSPSPSAEGSEDVKKIVVVPPSVEMKEKEHPKKGKPKTPPNNPTVEDHLRSSKLKPDEIEHAIKFYQANKSKAHAKHVLNPVGWVIDAVTKGRHQVDETLQSRAVKRRIWASAREYHSGAGFMTAGKEGIEIGSGSQVKLITYAQEHEYWNECDLN